MSNLVALPGARRKQRTFFFTRVELSQLLSVYSSRVATGEWRDYAIDQSDDTAIFSIFRHTHEHPLFAISKTMKRGHNRPSYALFNGPQRLKTALTWPMCSAISTNCRVWFQADLRALHIT